MKINGITFGIVTDGVRDITDVILSIISNNIDNFEIIVIGGERDYKEYGVVHFEFDESIKPSWITRKKNLITKYATYDNIVYMHDYITLDKCWYKNYNNNYDICCNRILNFDGTRFRDWCLNERHLGTFVSIGMNVYNRNMIIPYDKNFSKFMYVSGSYFLAKKYVMEEFPLDENLVWGQGEDVYWSESVTSKYNFTMNDLCVVNFLKQKDIALSYLDLNSVRLMETYYEQYLKNI